jgi:hypothetical protein
MIVALFIDALARFRRARAAAAPHQLPERRGVA